MQKSLKLCLQVGTTLILDVSPKTPVFSCHLTANNSFFSWDINITDHNDLSLNYATDMYVKGIRVCETKYWLRNGCEEAVVFIGTVHNVVGNVIQNNLKCLSESTDNLHTLILTSEPSYRYIMFIYTYLFMICVPWKTQNLFTTRSFILFQLTCLLLKVYYFH